MEWWGLSLISAAFSAVASIYEKKTLFKEGAVEFSASLALFNIVLSLPFAFSIDINTISLLQLLVLLLKSLLGALAFLYVMKGLKDLEISSALPLLVLTPGIVAFASFLLLNEHLTGYEIAGMALLLCGTYLLQTGSTFSLRGQLDFLLKSKGHRYILTALLLYSTTAILDKVILSKLMLPPVAFMLFEHLYFCVIFIIIFFIKGHKLRQLYGTISHSGRLLLIVSLSTIIYRFAQIWAVKIGSVALVLSLKRTAVFFAIIIGGRIFKDSSLLTRSIATAIMLAGAFLIVI